MQFLPMLGEMHRCLGAQSLHDLEAYHPVEPALCFNRFLQELSPLFCARATLQRGRSNIVVLFLLALLALGCLTSARFDMTFLCCGGASSCFLTMFPSFFAFVGPRYGRHTVPLLVSHRAFLVSFCHVTCVFQGCS